MSDRDSEDLQRLMRRILGANANRPAKPPANEGAPAPAVTVYGDVTIHIHNIAAPAAESARRPTLRGQATITPEALRRMLERVPPLADNRLKRPKSR